MTALSCGHVNTLDFTLKRHMGYTGPHTQGCILRAQCCTCYMTLTVMLYL